MVTAAHSRIDENTGHVGRHPLVGPLRSVRRPGLHRGTPWPAAAGTGETARAAPAGERDRRRRPRIVDAARARARAAFGPAGAGRLHAVGGLADPAIRRR